MRRVLAHNEALNPIFSVSLKYFIGYNTIKNKLRKRAWRELILKNLVFFNKINIF